MAAKKKAEQAVEQTAKVVQEVQHKFSKEQLLNAEAYRDKRDMVNALLDDNELYTKAEVNEKIKVFMTERKGE